MSDVAELFGEMYEGRILSDTTVWVNAPQYIIDLLMSNKI